MQPARKPVFLHILLENGRDLQQVPTDAFEMRILQRDLNGEITLRRTDIRKGLVSVPGEALSDGGIGRPAQSRHCLQEFFQARRLCIKPFEQLCCAVSNFVLRTACAKRLSQVRPERIKTM